jgi:hypothetical protein
VGINGNLAVIASGSSSYVFAGPTVTVTITSSFQKLVAAASVPLATVAGSPIINVNLGMCYSLSPGGPVTNFVGGLYSIVQISTTRTSHSVSATVTGLAPGTYQIGVGILNSSTTAIGNNDYVNGWVMLVN